MLKGFDKETQPLTEYEEKELLPVILAGLKTKTGKDNAVTNRTIVMRLTIAGYKIDEARCRKIINHIRTTDALPGLIATSGGYFLATTENELMDDVVILNDRLRKYVEAQEGANEEGEEEDNAEEQRGDVKYYKVEAEVTIKTEDEEEPNKTCYDFIVRTKDVDTAKVVITAWIDAKVKERTEKDGDERKIVDISILSAAPFACNAIVEKAFCMAYKDEEVK